MAELKPDPALESRIRELRRFGISVKDIRCIVRCSQRRADKALLWVGGPKYRKRNTNHSTPKDSA